MISANGRATAGRSGLCDDVGIAQVEGDRGDQTGMVMGSPGFPAPETACSFS